MSEAKGSGKVATVVLVAKAAYALFKVSQSVFRWNDPSKKYVDNVNKKTAEFGENFIDPKNILRALAYRIFQNVENLPQTDSYYRAWMKTIDQTVSKVDFSDDHWPLAQTDLSGQWYKVNFAFWKFIRNPALLGWGCAFGVAAERLGTWNHSIKNPAQDWVKVSEIISAIYANDSTLAQADRQIDAMVDKARKLKASGLSYTLTFTLATPNTSFDRMAQDEAINPVVDTPDVPAVPNDQTLMPTKNVFSSVVPAIVLGAGLLFSMRK